MRPLIEIRDLSVTFHGIQKVEAVSNVSISFNDHEVLALIGESGCGKTVIAHAIARLLPKEAVLAGEIMFEGKNLLSLDEEEMVAIRGVKIGVIFQNPSMALNPLHMIGRQVGEPLRLHKAYLNHQSLEGASQAIKRLGFLHPEKVMRLYPCQASGGMNQRFVMAASTILSPPFLIADEPTKGLDSDRVADVIAELRNCIRDTRSSLMLITHDIQVAQKLADRIAVMYAGEVVEDGPVSQVLSTPFHPYTRGLVGSFPENGFIPIPGMAPSPIALPKGCRFHPRCKERLDYCSAEHPPIMECQGRQVRCWLCR